jgi:hypothetical protein
MMLLLIEKQHKKRKKKRKQPCLSRLVQGNKETKTQRTKQQIKDKLDNHTKVRTKQG